MQILKEIQTFDREDRENRENRKNRDNRENSESRGDKENRDIKQNGENRENDENRDGQQKIVTPFMNQVYKITEQIPLGRITTYKHIAVAIGKPGASQAVGQALSVNPYAPKVPCHRVIASDGSIGGFRGTKNKTSPLIKHKIQLLQNEGIKIKNYKIVSEYNENDISNQKYINQILFIPKPL